MNLVKGVETLTYNFQHIQHKIVKNWISFTFTLTHFQELSFSLFESVFCSEELFFITKINTCFWQENLNLHNFSVCWEWHISVSTFTILTQLKRLTGPCNMQWAARINFTSLCDRKVEVIANTGWRSDDDGTPTLARLLELDDSCCCSLHIARTG